MRKISGEITFDRIQSHQTVFIKILFWFKLDVQASYCHIKAQTFETGLTIRFWLKEFRRFYPLSFNSIHQLITHYDKFSTDPILNYPTSEQRWITWLKYHNSKTNLLLSFSVHTKNQRGLFIRESLIRMIWFMRLEIINKKIMDFRNILTMNVLIN